jgi:hypothetical protein
MNETGTEASAAATRRTSHSGPTESPNGATVAARVHDLKTWPEYFAAVMSGAKTFEFRKNDRGFQAGDILRLREYSPGPDEYTGREISKCVTYILTTADFTPVTIGLRPGYCVMALGDAARATEGGEPGTVQTVAAEDAHPVTPQNKTSLPHPTGRSAE